MQKTIAVEGQYVSDDPLLLVANRRIKHDILKSLMTPTESTTKLSGKTEGKKSLGTLTFVHLRKNGQLKIL